MKIYIFRRKDGTYWAEYSEKCSKRQGTIVDFVEAASRADYEYLVEHGHPKLATERVKALADRGLDEYLETLKVVNPAPVYTPRTVPVAAREVPREVPRATWWRSLLPSWVTSGR